MLERTDTLTNEFLEPILFVPAYVIVHSTRRTCVWNSCRGKTAECNAMYSGR